MAKAFSLQLADFAKKAGANAEQVVRKVGIDVLKGVVLKSPVDTGRFRANWQVGIGAIGKQKNSVDPTGSIAIAEGTGRINRVPIGESIWISNSLPYSQRLENGYSTQAPSGMVRLTITQYADFVRNAVRQLP